MAKVQEDDGPATALAVQTAQALPANLAILRMENENIMALAAAHPRDHKQIKADLLAQLEAYPAFADEAIYCKPVGTVTEVVCQCGHKYEAPRQIPRDGVPCPRCEKWEPVSQRRRQKFARGLSVRSAEALAEAYGYNRVRADLLPFDADTIKVEASFVDYQRGRIWQSAGLASRLYKDRFGRMQRTSEDRFNNLVVKAEISRQVREVITRSVPPGLRAELFQGAERVQHTLLTDEKVTKILGAFATLGVSEVQLEAVIGRTRKQGWTERDRLDLQGIWQAIDDGETTVDAVFAELDGEPAQATQPEKPLPAGGGVSIEDLTGPAPTPKPAAKVPPEPRAPAVPPQLAPPAIQATPPAIEQPPAAPKPNEAPAAPVATASAQNGQTTFIADDPATPLFDQYWDRVLATKTQAEINRVAKTIAADGRLEAYDVARLRAHVEARRVQLRATK